MIQLSALTLVIPHKSAVDPSLRSGSVARIRPADLTHVAFTYG